MELKFEDRAALPIAKGSSHYLNYIFLHNSVSRSVLLSQRGYFGMKREDDWKAAWVAYECGEAGQAGIVDHVSFQGMCRLGITEAFTNDKHYQSAGFTVLF